MAATSPTLSSLRAHIRSIRQKVPEARVFGISSEGRWSGPARDGVGENGLVVYQCDSPLQMRLALQEAAGQTGETVLLTRLDQTLVSDDILARLALRRLVPFRAWEIVRSLFNAKTVDTRITRHGFLADLLLEHADGITFEAASGGFLDGEVVWGILLKARFGLEIARPDLQDLLRHAAENNLAGRWQAASADLREAAAEWMGDWIGATGQMVLEAIGRPNGARVLAAGLVMGVVYHKGVGHELDKAAGKMEAYLELGHLGREAAGQWHDAARGALERLAPAALARSMDEAEKILEAVGAGHQAWRSDILESGFEQRLSSFGRGVTAHVGARASGISDEFRNIYRSVKEHRAGETAERRMERVDMAARLCRWLAEQHANPEAWQKSLVEMAKQYAGDGGFVDWARQVLRGGEPNKELAGAFMHLLDAVTRFREGQNHQFAMALADQKAAGQSGAGLIPLEEVLEQAVARVAMEKPVLVLLVDGMSWAVYRELLSDLETQGWHEGGLDGRRLMGLCALPSVTEVCRTSLFCGVLRCGHAADEKQGFAAHSGLLAGSKPGYPPQLFHKAALQGDEDSSLATDIRNKLADAKQQVVGIVINAVDDHLDKGDQTDAIWSSQYIRVLGPILAEARDAGRVVILASDHGHILDRQTEGREGGEGLRWRGPVKAAGAGEIEIGSLRVLLPAGGRVVAPWSEALRYGPKKNGYHGGVTPQEMLVPIGFLYAQPDLPKVLDPLGADLPSWWTEPLIMVAAGAPTSAVVKPVAEGPPAAAPMLFDVVVPPEGRVPYETPEMPWIRALLESEIYKVQMEQVARMRISEADVRKVLSALASRGGTMTNPALAGAVGIAEHRLPGFLAGLQRLLNIEGYQILERDMGANTLKLNTDLLKKQFEIEL